MSEALAAPVAVGACQRLTAEVRRLTQDNPGPFTGPGTNSYLIGRPGAPQIVLDPGEDREDGHLERLLGAIADDPVAAVLVSHAHPDHWPLAPRLAARCDAPVLAHQVRGGLAPDRRVDEGDELTAGDLRLRVLHTPGHASDHLCFLLEERRALFSADHVMGWSTTVIAPPDGDLRAYLATLDRLLELDVDLYFPGHGDVLPEPHRRVAELRAHRQRRTAQLVDALRAGAGTPAELVARVYTDVDPRLHPAARMSLLAHLEALAADGLAAATGEAGDDPARVRWTWTGDPR
ncbi:MAG TPA: MBL fold metallo-hydrolase [Thermoanaerobaculia bacterium]|nr:MBL fold metallo-hydrolase [Thermoanaerobaculia bacterium]